MKMRFILMGVIALCVLSGGLSQSQIRQSPVSITGKKISYIDLVEKLTDLECLATLPAPGEKCRQWSSYDRASCYDEAAGKYVAWTANGDGVGIIRNEGGLQVFAEMEGPGVIWRIWSARADRGHVKITLDGNPEPDVDLPFIQYFDLTQKPFTYPALVHQVAKGFNNYIPIPFQKSCKIVGEKDWGYYYHFNYTTYPKGTMLPTFTRNLSEAELAALERANHQLTETLGTDPAGRRRGQVTERRSVTVESDKTSEVIEINGEYAITGIKVHVEDLPATPADRDVLRGLALSIQWDGQKEPGVWAPLGDFFGTAPGVNFYTSLPLGMTDDGFYSFWYMPFGKSALIKLSNDTEKSQTVHFTLDYAPVTKHIRTLGRFHAKWHLDAFLPSEPERREIDWTLMKTEGAGRFCGVALHIWNPQGGWWGEGDEKFFVDGEKLPSTFGTGSEDYFGYAWGSATLFQNGYHNQTISSNNKGHISVNRWHITDNVPFLKSFEGAIEKYFPNNKPTRYSSTVYWYQAAGQTDLYPPVDAIERLDYCVEAEVVPKGGMLDGVFVGETDVALTCAMKDVEIRYTLDGTEPTSESALFVEPIHINKTSTLYARAFKTKGDKTIPIGETVVIKRTQTQYKEAVRVEKAVNGTDYACFEGAWNAMPDFSKLQPVRTGKCDNFVMQQHKEDFFAFQFTGFIKVASDGIYSFSTISDDGSQLYIGDHMVVNNDGLHSPEQKEAQIALKAGFHQITVTMFERDGGEELDVLYAGPGISQRQIPKDVLFTACPAQSAPASGSPDGKKTEGMAEQK